MMHLGFFLSGEGLFTTEPKAVAMTNDLDDCARTIVVTGTAKDTIQADIRYVMYQLAEIAVPRRLLAEILRLIDDLRPKTVPT